MGLLDTKGGTHTMRKRRRWLKAETGFKYCLSFERRSRIRAVGMADESIDSDANRNMRAIGGSVQVVLVSLVSLGAYVLILVDSEVSVLAMLY